MNDVACTTLAARFEGERARGLVDVKYYVHGAGPAKAEKVCEEAVAVFALIDANAIEAFAFGDARSSRHDPMA